MSCIGLDNFVVIPLIEFKYCFVHSGAETIDFKYVVNMNKKSFTSHRNVFFGSVRIHIF